MEETTKLIGPIGGTLGIVAFVWRLLDEYTSYLQIGIEVRKNGKTVTALTKATNRGMRKKCLDYAVLLVGPELESPVDTANKIKRVLCAEVTIENTNDIAKLKAYMGNTNEQKQVTSEDGKGSLIQLPFFYSEQVRIADEELAYRSSINTENMRKGYYAVRFFVFTRGRLHRSTQDLFYLDTESAERKTPSRHQRLRS